MQSAVAAATRPKSSRFLTALSVRFFQNGALCLGLGLCAAWTCPGFENNEYTFGTEPSFGTALLNQDSVSALPSPPRSPTSAVLTGLATFLDHPSTGPDGLVQARLSLSNELLGKTKNALPVDFFKISLGLEQSSELELLEKGRIIFWQQLSNSAPGWSAQQVPGKGGLSTIGSAYVAVPSITLRKFNVGSIQNQVFDLAATMATAGLSGNAETFVLFEDPRYPDNVKDHYKQLFKARVQGSDFYVPPEIALDGLPSATRSNLPDASNSPLFVLDSSNISARGGGRFTKTVSFQIPNQGKIEAKFELEEIPGTPLVAYPSRAAGHTLINSIEINSDFSSNGNFEIFAYKKAVGKTPFQVENVMNARSLFDGKQRIDGIALEDFGPRDWNKERYSEYRLAVIFRIGSQYFSVLTLEQGAVDASNRANTASLFYRMSSN